jgi:indole-3-glycerol phosphate synthase
MSNILKEIAAHKIVEVAQLQESLSLEAIQEQLDYADLIDFKAALENHSAVNIIAEIKKASPSRGVLTDEFDPETIAARYKSGGAAALSVLVDKKYFQGSYRYLEIAKESSRLPVLCKEFIVDQYQIYYARLMKADAVLLIVRLLPANNLKEFIRLSKKLGMAALVEVHDRSELKTAVDCGAEIIGVNNRNLEDFTVSLKTSEQLAELIPKDAIKVSESGIFESDHVRRLKQAGFNNFLIGEALITSADPMELLNDLRNV